jgi:NAD(P)-dependent dehydrogenase (short-subunit alcohol dehydrogenase family)
MRLAGKTAVVTGATYGLGLEALIASIRDPDSSHQRKVHALVALEAKARQFSDDKRFAATASWVRDSLGIAVMRRLYLWPYVRSYVRSFVRSHVRR